MAATPLTENSRRMLICSTLGSGRLMNLTATSRPLLKSLKCHVSPVPPWPAGHARGRGVPPWRAGRRRAQEWPRGDRAPT